MTAPDLLGVVDEEVGEPVVEAPPVDGLEADEVGGGRGDAPGKGLRLNAVEELTLFFSGASIAAPMGCGRWRGSSLLGSCHCCIYLPSVLQFNDFLFIYFNV